MNFKDFFKKMIIRIILAFFISFFLIIYLSNISEDKIQYFNQLDYNVTLNQDGSIDIVETWDIYVEDTGTLFKNFSLSSIYGDITNVKVKDLENNLELTEIYEEVYHVGNNLFYALDIGNNVFEIAWGTGMSTSSGNRKYQVSYTIDNAITSYNDCQEFYWQFIAQGKNSIPAKLVTGTITLPQDVQNIENLKVWGHGQVNGNIEIASNNEVEFEINNLQPGAMLEIRVVTEEELFNVSSTREMNYSYLTNIISEETEWSNSTNQVSMIFKIVVSVIYALILIICIVKIIKYKKINKKENDGIIKKELQYYREIPREGSSTPNEAIYLYYFNKDKLETASIQSQMVSSTILNLCLKKEITIEIDRQEIYISIVGDGSSLNHEEYQVFELLSNASKNREKLEINDLNEYAKKHYSSYSVHINKMINETRNSLYKMQLIDKKEEKVYASTKHSCEASLTIIFIYAILLFFIPIMHLGNIQMYIDISIRIGFMESLSSFTLAILPLVILIAYTLYVKGKITDKIGVITQKGYDEQLEWKGLKKYLEDYSLLNEKEIPQLVVWEKYLVYATAFGIADKVIEQMKSKYPTVFLEDSWNEEMRRNYPIIYFSINPHYHVTTTVSPLSRLDTGVTRAYTTTVREIAAHRSSSGSGGGGGFSGGGGRRRWPVAGMGGR